MRLVFSAGGTGGHIFPALAVADEIKKRHPKAEILFIGAEGKMEMERVPKAGYPIKGLWISGFLGKSIFSKMKTLIKLFHSMLKSRKILKDFNPDIVLGFGGFASVAPVFTATLMRYPTMVQEQNSFPGLTNRLLGKRVDAVCTSYEVAGKALGNKNVHLTGNPVRSGISEPVSKKEALEHFKLDANTKTVLVVGGSLGARTFNRAMRDSTKEIKKSGVQFIWQIGKGNFEDFRISQTAELPNVLPLAFLDRMDLAYAVADVVVARAGALTISEMSVLGKATLLVPSPNVSEDHQTKNAMALVEKDAAKILRDNECEEKMINEVLGMIQDNEVIKNLEKNIKKLARPNATSDIADLIEKIIKS